MCFLRTPKIYLKEERGLRSTPAVPQKEGQPSAFHGVSRQVPGEDKFQVKSATIPLESFVQTRVWKFILRKMALR